jgi:hypothetical protein
MAILMFLAQCEQSVCVCLLYIYGHTVCMHAILHVQGTQQCLQLASVFVVLGVDY